MKPSTRGSVRRSVRHVMAASIFAVVEHREEGLLRDLDVPYLFHTLLALFLLFEKLPFSRDIAAVALGRHVFAQGRDALAGDHPAADGRLDRHLELMALDLALELLDQLPAAAIGVRPVDDRRECIDPLAGDQDIEPAEVAGLDSRSPRNPSCHNRGSRSSACRRGHRSSRPAAARK